MLLQFTVETVLSFRDQAVLSLMAAPHVDHRPEHVVELPGVSAPVLRVAALYGANASGKSNLVKALNLAAKLAVEGIRPKATLAVPRFALETKPSTGPSRFEFELWKNAARWSYGFTVANGLVESEWLFSDDGNGERPVFERANSTYKIGDGVPLSPERTKFWEFVAEGTRDNQFFLAEAAERNVQELRAPQEALEQIVCAPAGFNPPELPNLLARVPAALDVATSLVRDSGTGIARVDLRFEDTDLQEWFDAKRKSPSDDGSPSDDEFSTRLSEADVELWFKHRVGGGSVTFTEESESDGTRRLVGLSIALLLAERFRRTLVIDELDRSLHTLVARQLIRRFQHASNQHAGQLIFTTHDTNLLDLNLLPRDSIWFVEKDAAGASSLYSLADFDAEQIEAMGPSLEQGYLAGRFGAIPFLGDAQRLGWLKKSAS